jgi:hypothetical protein
VSCSTNASATLRTTTNRLAEMQLWPPLTRRERAAVRAATATSASARTTNGSLPPSSSTERLRWRPASVATARPAAVEPVRVTAATRGSAMTRSIWSGPSRTLGASTPTSANRASRASPHPGVHGACLSRKLLPATRAGAANRMYCQNGKFHGMMANTTPSGSYCTQLLEASEGNTSAASQRGPCSATYSQVTAHFSISALPSASGLPISAAIRRASSSARARSAGARARASAARSRTGVRRKRSNVAWARDTARSTSAAVAVGNGGDATPVLGSTAR